MPIQSLLPLGHWKLFIVDIDFSTYSDGALPSALSGSTWTVSSGLAVNAPTLGSEKLTDPDLEANYTTGKCDTLTKNGSPTLAQSADVHAGSKAQEITATAFNDRLNWPTFAGVSGQWYLYTVWTKRTAGSTDTAHARIFQTSQLLSTQEAELADSSYTQKNLTLISTSTNAIFVYPAVETGSSSFSTIVADDASFKAITYSSLFALLESSFPDAVVKAKPSGVDHAFAGIVVRADAQTNPTNAIFAVIHIHPGNVYYDIALFKKIGSTYTTLISTTAVAKVSGGWLEVRTSGSTVQVFYDGTQVGTDQTVSDAELVDNKYHGIFTSGSTSFSRFFCKAKQLVSKTVVWGGSSITINANTWAFRNQSATYLKGTFPRFDFTFQASAVSGWATWPNLIKMQTSVLDYSPDLVVLDTANNDGSSMDNATIEAYIRRVWAANPKTRILLWVFFAVADQNVNANVNSPTDVDNETATAALASHYNIPLLDYWSTIKTRVNDEGHNLSEYMNDTIHPNQTGHNEAYALLKPYLLSTDGSSPSTLPDRLYDNGDFENTPVVTLGTSYDSRTGTWSDTGTRTQSSTVGDTITFSATCQSFGCYRADGGSNDVTVSIDGGAFTAMSFYENGTPVSAGRGAHTFIIKVNSGTVRIDEFWAI